MQHYEPPCRPFGLSEFSDPFDIMEWCHAHPPMMRGLHVRQLRRHDLISLVTGKGMGITFMVGDLEKDTGFMYPGCRVQHDSTSLCPYVLIPLKIFVGSAFIANE